MAISIYIRSAFLFAIHIWAGSLNTSLKRLLKVDTLILATSANEAMLSIDL